MARAEAASTGGYWLVMYCVTGVGGGISWVVSEISRSREPWRACKIMISSPQNNCAEIAGLPTTRSSTMPLSLLELLVPLTSALVVPHVHGPAAYQFVRQAAPGFSYGRAEQQQRDAVFPASVLLAEQSCVSVTCTLEEIQNELYGEDGEIPMPGTTGGLSKGRISALKKLEKQEKARLAELERAASVTPEEQAIAIYDAIKPGMPSMPQLPFVDPGASR